MSNAPEDFEQLRKLLKLKRYEQPPPRFFNDFSLRVINGIEAGTEHGWMQGLDQHAPWLVRFLRRLESNVLVAGGFATAICATLIGGIVYSTWQDSAVAASNNTTSPGIQPMALAGDHQGGLVGASDLTFTDTNALLSSFGGSSLEPALPSLRTVPATYTLPQR